MYLSRKYIFVVVVFFISIIGLGEITFIESIDVGADLHGIDINTATNKIYVAQLGRNKVFVIDGSSNTVIDSVEEVGSWPRCVAANPSTNCIYVTNYTGRSVTAIDGTTDTILDTIDVQTQPTGIALNSFTNRIYVANFADDTVSVISGAASSTIDSIAVGNNPNALEVNPKTNRIYVANRDDGDVYVIDGTDNSIIDTIDFGLMTLPNAVDVDTLRNLIYVLNVGIADEIQVIDGETNSVIDTVELDYQPGDLCVNPSTNRVYVTLIAVDSVVVYDRTQDSIIDAIEVDAYPFYITANPQTDRIYVSCDNAGTVCVLEDKIVTGVDIPSDTQSSLNFNVSPNPFSGSIEIFLNIPVNAKDARFSIYNATGILVKSFSLAGGSSSPITLHWDGKDFNGKKCASGVYIGTLEATNNRPSQGKILLVN
jgi:YVTN family beta-propeller protein